MPKGGSRVGAGRKVLPFIVKEAKGTLRKERIKDTPTPTDKLPTPPRWLNPAAKTIFRMLVRRISSITVASQDHTNSIAMLASRVEEVERFDKYLNEVGYTYERQAVVGRGDNQRVITVGIYARPEAKLRHEAMRHLHSLLLEFGLTPASLGRVKAKGKEKEHNEFSDF